MSVKMEYKESGDDVESGQCSDDEVQIIKKEKKSKKHKRKDKLRKTRKRKYSHSPSCERSITEFFNPYSVNPGKFILKAECVQMVEISDNQYLIAGEGLTNEEVISETFSNLFEINNDTSIQKISLDSNVKSKPNVQNKDFNSVNDFRKQQLNKRREFEYSIDISGIDTLTSDLYHYLLDLGLSSPLVNDLMKVFDKEEKEQESISDHEDDDGYEEQMINDIPIIDQSKHSDEGLCNGGYSPERVNVIMEPYKPHKNVAYAPVFQNTTNDRPLDHIIDPLSIPQVGPRDPRLNQGKTLLQMKPIAIIKHSDEHNDKISPNPEMFPVISKEWETTVVNVVKTHLALYLTHNDINKEEYKSILKRAVTKILTSGEKKLETDKISKFLHSYVMMIQKSRI